MIINVPCIAQDDDVMMLEANDKDACLQCHDQTIAVHKFDASAHGKVSCQQCHKGIDRYPHPEKAMAAKPLCANCHNDKARGFSKSVHAHAKLKSSGSVNCQSCHGDNAHEIARPSKLSVKQQEASCRSCHAKNAKLLSGSVHGASSTAHAGKNAANCLSCHGGNPHTIPAPATSADRQNALCLRCHPVDSSKMFANAHGKALAKPDSRLKCLSCHNGNPHAITPPLKLNKQAKNSQCETCHTKNSTSLAHSAHGNTNMETGNRPDCLYCHGDDFHKIIPVSQMAPTQKDAACKSCHSEVSKRLSGSVHGKANAKPGKPAPGCLVCHGEGNPHDVIQTAKLDRTAKQRSCENCHSDLSKSLKDSVHNRPDKVPGDHPTCFTCHGDDAHGIHTAPKLTPKEKVAVCATCHSDTERMARYGRTDAVEAYSLTYHGRAILRFNHTKEATCVDCHGMHGIQAPDKPNAPTNARNANKICSKCHAGNNMTFAYTYASHQRMKVDKSLISPLEKLFIRLIRPGVFAFIVIMFILGIIIKFTKRLPISRALPLYDYYSAMALSGLIVSLITILSMYSMGIFKEPTAPQSTFVAAVVLLISSVFYIVAGIFIKPLKSSPPISNIDE